MLTRTGSTLLFLALSTSVVAESDHQSAPMLSSPTKALNGAQLKKAQNEINNRPNEVNLNTSTIFKKTYSDAGKPKIAIFWNKELDDRLSQWETISRKSSTDRWSNSEKLNFQYSEIRAEEKVRDGLNERDDFEFNAGFIGTLTDNSVNVIDRVTIMRLAERDKYLAAGREIISDYTKVETEALVGYADLFSEVLFSPDKNSDFGFSFLVNIREVETGRIIAKFVSSGKPPLTQKKSRSVYVMTPSGYQKKTIVENDKTITLRKMGEQLAYDTMRALTVAFNAR